VALTCLGYGRSTSSTAANQQMEAQAKGKDLGINMVTLVQKHLGTKATNEQRKPFFSVSVMCTGRNGKVGTKPNLDANRNRALAGLIREHARLIRDLTAANF
jgi:hypothetical protein